MKDITQYIENTIIVQGVQSKDYYLLNNWSYQLLALYRDGKWYGATGETKTNYYEGSPDFIIIK